MLTEKAMQLKEVDEFLNKSEHYTSKINQN